MKLVRSTSPLKKVPQVILAILLLCTQHISGQAKDTLRVLFVGNSYTFFWNMPRIVSVIAASQGKAIITRKSTVGGAYLKEHWEEKRGLKSRELISGGKWDVVVLQNNSMSAITKHDQFMEYGKKLINLVKEKGAIPILYETWAREYNPLMQKQITNAYETLAAETGAKLAPVGSIWMGIRKLRPDLRMYFPDGSHPSNIASYLIACIFYETITGNKTASVPNQIATIDKNGERLYLSMLTKQDAGFIHQAVDDYFSQKAKVNK